MRLSVIMPSYRQAATISKELVHLDRYLQTIAGPHEIILVIDGNNDQTLETVTNNVALPSLRVLCLPRNQGKGAALRRGCAIARGDLIIFLDAGGDVHFQGLASMLELQQQHQADIIVGSKRHPQSRVAYPPLRRLYSYLYQRLNRLLFGLDVRDTQAGFKLFRRAAIQAIIPHSQVARFAFDLEILVIARRLGFHRIIEAPVTIRYRFNSTIDVSAAFKMLYDTWRIFYRHRLFPITLVCAATP